jgi:hypothetical protein
MVAKYDQSKRHAIPQQLGRGAFEMPTSIYETTEGEVLFGDEAVDEGESDHLNHIRRFKMKLGHPGPAHVGRKSGTAEQLSAEFLTHVRLKLEKEVLHHSVENAVLTVPAMFGPAQRKSLKAAAEAAGLTHVALLEEPVAAGIAYCDQSEVKGALRFLVVDWGGGTFDVALVERPEGQEARVIHEVVDGLDDIGGETLDDCLWQAASDLLMGAGHQALDRQEPTMWGRYRRDITRAKERLSTRDEVRMSFLLDGGSPAPIILNLKTLEEAIGEAVKKGADFVGELLQRCRSAGYPPDFILLAGGTSRIPMVERVFSETLKIECRTWSQGREAIALGAALHAKELWGQKPAAAPPRDPEVTPKTQAKSVYRALLEGAWADGKITETESEFLNRKRQELKLTKKEAETVERQILGKTLAETSRPPKDAPRRKEATEIKETASRRKGRETEAILKIIRCEFLKSPITGIYLHPDIPPKKLRNALDSYGGPRPTSDILLLHDITLWGGAKDGIMMTRSAILWKDYGGQPQVVDYRRMTTIEVVNGLFGAKGVKVNGEEIPLSTDKKVLAQMFRNILVKVKKLVT